MATSISSIFDNLVSLVGGALTTYKRLPNPYVVQENNQLFLAKGYGVAFGPGAVERLHVGCKISYRRTFSILLTNLVATTEQNTASRATIEKGLIEDFITLRIALENNLTLSGEAIDVTYSDDSGIIYGATDENLKFLSIEIGVSCLYEEILA